MTFGFRVKVYELVKFLSRYYSINSSADLITQFSILNGNTDV
jgi:hypothetical protein